MNTPYFFKNILTKQDTKTKQKKETENNCWELNAGFVHLQFCAKPVCPIETV
jgi:hypothetical protein